MPYHYPNEDWVEPVFVYGPSSESIVDSDHTETNSTFDVRPSTPYPWNADPYMLMFRVYNLESTLSTYSSSFNTITTSIQHVESILYEIRHRMDLLEIEIIEIHEGIMDLQSEDESVEEDPEDDHIEQHDDPEEIVINGSPPS